MPLALPAAEVLVRNHVRVSGRQDGRPLVFVHGFACDQRMWEQIAGAFEDSHRVVTLDLVGAGQSDVTAYDVLRHGRVDLIGPSARYVDDPADDYVGGLSEDAVAFVQLDATGHCPHLSAPGETLAEIRRFLDVG